MSDREFQRPSRDVEEGKREPVSEGESESTSYATPTTGEQALGEKTGPPAFVNDAPDGGTAAWLCVLGAWCTSFCSFGWLNSMGAFQEYYQTGPLSSYSASTVAWIPSLQIFFIFAMGPIVGKFYDSHGPRPLLLLGSFLHVFGIMMASISTRYYQFLLSQGVCSAIGVAFIFQPPHSLYRGLVQQEPRRRIWHPLHGKQYRRHHIPHHDHPVDSDYRIRMVHAGWCVHDPRVVGHCQLDRDIQTSSQT